MTPEIFAEWMRRQGRRVVKTASSYWCNQGWRAYQAFPYHWLIQPSREELSDLMTGSGALALRYSVPPESGTGRMSYHAVYAGAPYELERLTAWARKNVRRGLRSCSVEPISFERLASEGWELHWDTFDRQRRGAGLSKQAWRRRCLTAGELPGFEAWGALVQGRLAASISTFAMQDCCYLLDQQCRREHLPAHLNNALSYVVTQNMCSRREIRSLFYALQSLDAPDRVDEFKFRMGYQAKPVRQRVVFHSCLAPAANPIGHALLKMLLSYRPGNPVLSKAEGMLRFYLEGRLPVPAIAQTAMLIKAHRAGIGNDVPA